MAAQKKSTFVSQLCMSLFGETDSFALARTFAKSVLKHSSLHGAILIWPESQEPDTQETPGGSVVPLRSETLGKKKAKQDRLYSVRFHERGDLFFRIDFYGSVNSRLSAKEKADFREGHRLVSRAIQANEDRNRKEEQNRFQWMRRLTAGLSHELNTPLTTILYGAKKLARDGGDTSGIATQLQASVEGVTRVLQQYQVLAGDGQFVEFESVDLTTLRNRIERAVKTTFKTESNWLKFQAKNLGGSVSIHAADIERLAIAIIQNSIDALKSVERSGLEPNIEISFERRDEMLRISITDNGPGILSENRPFIFAPFFSTKEVGQGAGLGLSVARAIAFLNNGSLHLNPLSSRTQFVLELPVIKQVSNLKPRSSQGKAA